MKQRKINYLIIFLLLCIILNNFSINSFAKTPTVRFQDGNFIFTTEDTTASSGTRWKTVGFTVTRQKCKPSGGDPTDYPYAIFWLRNDDWKQETVVGDITYVKFTIPKDVVSKALVLAGFSELQEGETVYIHGIHRVTHGGDNYGPAYYDLKGIANAEPWANADDFDDRFDIPVGYEGGLMPVEVEYRTSTGAIIETKIMPDSYWAKAGEPISIKFFKTKPIDYTLYASRYVFLATKANIPGTWKDIYGSDKVPIDEVQNRTIQRQRIGGVKFVAYMKTPAPIGSSTGQELIPPNPHGVIAADVRDNEQYDVTEGIPTTENLYVNVFSENYLFGYNFTQKTGIKQYPVTISKTYNLTWTEKDPVTKKDVPKTDTQTVTKTMTVNRPYSYYYIDNLDVYGINSSKVNNYALPSGSTNLSPSGYTPPSVTYKNSTALDDHIKDPVYEKLVSLGSQSVSGSGSKPSVPDESSLFQSTAEDKVKQILVKNDLLVFNGTTILEDTYQEKVTPEPVPYEMDVEEIGENVLYNSGLTIGGTKANGPNSTTGTITYNRIAQVNSKYSSSLTYDVADLTDVVIHTPTVCDATIESKTRNNQMLFPDKSVASLVLDTNFNINLPTTGNHRYIQGYEYRDYEKYISSRQVQFPFDVYNGNTYIKAGTWISLYSDITGYYLPIWVDEGYYTINFRSESINAAANGGLGSTESLANLSLSNYVATDTVRVQVSGRLYGLNLYDISDYPTWQSVFRQPNSTKHTGFSYPLGAKDRNGTPTGINPKYTISLVNGSHPTAQSVGMIKTGYVTRFSLSTIGNMYGQNDYIRIVPSFYYVDKNGNNRQEVDIYYSETFLNKKHTLVKMGSDLDLLNKKSLRLGDTYRNVPITEISLTARLKAVTDNVLKGTKKNVFTYTNIMIPEALRTFIGTNYSPTKTVPAGVDPDKVSKSMQRWFGEYYIPSEVHVVAKGFDVLQYAKENGAIDYYESIWLKDGYIIVNFDIETIKDNARYLSYINRVNSDLGYCNMWNTEGYQYNKTGINGESFTFIDGDYVIYDTNQSAAIDYISRGTH